VESPIQTPFSCSTPGSPLSSRSTAPHRLFLSLPKQSRPGTAVMHDTRKLSNPLGSQDVIGPNCSPGPDSNVTIADDIAACRFIRPGLPHGLSPTCHPALTTQLFGKLPPQAVRGFTTVVDEMSPHRADSVRCLLLLKSYTFTESQYCRFVSFLLIV
jgi:hypothetical protein